ncbi:hypothetical protein ZWY2020_055491 [Hordeum vulgare]|nr:hypothetical protein ZWY2020_055491 [Hordeum vulgare]
MDAQLAVQGERAAASCRWAPSWGSRRRGRDRRRGRGSPRAAREGRYLTRAAMEPTAVPEMVGINLNL